MANLENRLTALESGSPAAGLSNAEVKQNIEKLVGDSLVNIEASHLRQLESMESLWATSFNESLDKLDAKEREQRKLRLIIKGLSEAQSASPEAVKNFIYDKFKLSDGIVTVNMELGRQWPSITVANWKIKQLILTKKREILQNSSIYVDTDLTPRESKIMKSLRLIAKKEKENGKRVKVRHLKICVNSKWSVCDEVRQKLIPSTDLPRKFIDRQPQPGFPSGKQGQRSNSSIKIPDFSVEVTLWNSNGPGRLAEFVESCKGPIIFISETWTTTTPYHLSKR